MADPISDLVGGLAGALVPKQDTTQSDTATAQGTSSAAAQQGEQSAIDFGKSTEAAKAATGNIGEAEKKAAGTDFAPLQGSAAGAVGSAAGQAANSKQASQNGITQVNNATIAAGDAINRAASLAPVDPQRYLTNLGVSGRTLASLGVALSGLGAGLTGQPNMAMEILQKNIDRDIDSQKDLYQRKINEVSQQQNLIKTGLDQQNVAQQSYFGAQQTVLSGAQAAAALAMQKLGLSVGDQKAVVVQNQLQKQKIEATDAHTDRYVSNMHSGDTRTQNLMYNAATTVADQVGGTHQAPPTSSSANPNSRAATGGSKFSLVPTTAPAAPPAQSAPASFAAQSTPSRASSPSFLEALSNKIMGK